MEFNDKQRFIQEKARDQVFDSAGEKILWSRHGVAALIDDGLSRTDVEAALQRSHIIEDYLPTHRPLPDCLVLALISPDKPVHAVIAIDEAHDRIFIVTVYVPTIDRWEDDWQTRKR